MQEHAQICQRCVCSTDDDDEFDTFDQSPTVIGQCRAIYDYAASQYDELTIKPGAYRPASAEGNCVWVALLLHTIIEKKCVV